MPFNSDGDRLLHEAVKNRCFDTAMMLLNRGAHPEPLNKWGASPLYFAVRHGNTEVARALLEREANPERICFDTSMIAIAIQNADYKMLQLFAEFHVNFNATLPGGKTPLELVPNYDQLMTFFVLLQQTKKI